MAPELPSTSRPTDTRKEPVPYRNVQGVRMSFAESRAPVGSSRRLQHPDTPHQAHDRQWMARALEMARAAAREGEVPVGAILVRDGELLVEGHNRTIADVDPTAHAEVVVIRKGARLLGDWRLLGCTLYATLEPCTLCAGALVLSRVQRLVYATPDPKAGMAGSLEDLVRDRRLNHFVEVTAGVLAEPASRLLKSFFRERRG